VGRDHDEPMTTAGVRLELRYVEPKQRESSYFDKRTKLVARVLMDELDLSGQRFSTALRRWQGTVDFATVVQEGDDVNRYASHKELVERVQAFWDDHETARLVQVIETTHSAEAEDLFRNMMSFENDGRVIHEPCSEETESFA